MQASSRNRLGLAVVGIALAGVAAQACSGTIVVEGGPAADAGNTPVTTPIATPDPGPSSGPIPTPLPPPPPEYDAGPPGSTLYDRLGQHAGIQQFIGAVLSQALMDPQQASYFVFQTMPGSSGGTTGHPTAAQLIECFTDLVGSATGGPETYPPFDTTATGGFVCRSMKAAHATLHIPNGVFNDFVAIIVQVATAANVSPADIANLGALVDSVQAQIVDPARADGGYFEGGH